LLRWDAEKHEVVQYRLEGDRGIFCQGIAQAQRSVRRQFGDKPIQQRPCRVLFIFFGRRRALARATSIGPRAATGLEVSADAAGGIPRYGITRRGGNNDRLSTLWREVISLAGVAMSFSSGGG
jgi:hypothetical protein